MGEPRATRSGGQIRSGDWLALAWSTSPLNPRDRGERWRKRRSRFPRPPSAPSRGGRWWALLAPGRRQARRRTHPAGAHRASHGPGGKGRAGPAGERDPHHCGSGRRDGERRRGGGAHGRDRRSPDRVRHGEGPAAVRGNQIRPSRFVERRRARVAQSRAVSIGRASSAGGSGCGSKRGDLRRIWRSKR